jgi:hypothetical protein
MNLFFALICRIDSKLFTVPAAKQQRAADAAGVAGDLVQPRHFSRPNAHLAFTMLPAHLLHATDARNQSAAHPQRALVAARCCSVVIDAAQHSAVPLYAARVRGSGVDCIPC